VDINQVLADRAEATMSRCMSIMTAATCLRLRQLGWSHREAAGSQDRAVERMRKRFHETAHEVIGEMSDIARNYKTVEDCETHMLAMFALAGSQVAGDLHSERSN